MTMGTAFGLEPYELPLVLCEIEQAFQTEDAMEFFREEFSARELRSLGLVAPKLYPPAKWLMTCEDLLETIDQVHEYSNVSAFASLVQEGSISRDPAFMEALLLYAWMGSVALALAKNLSPLLDSPESAAEEASPEASRLDELLQNLEDHNAKLGRSLEERFAKLEKMVTLLGSSLGISDTEDE